MSYSDNSKKFTVVVNGRCPLLRLLNALGHATAGLAASMPPGEADYLDYENEPEGFKAKISRFPIVVLKAKNSNQLSVLRKAAAEQQIAHNVFVAAMIGASAEEQLAQTRNTTSEQMEYWVVALFGSAERLTPLTKRFSLFNLQPTAAGETEDASA